MARLAIIEETVSLWRCMRSTLATYRADNLKLILEMMSDAKSLHVEPRISLCDWLVIGTSQHI
jgi:hypothetical protein